MERAASWRGFPEGSCFGRSPFQANTSSPVVGACMGAGQRGSGISRFGGRLPPPPPTVTPAAAVACALDCRLLRYSQHGPPAVPESALKDCRGAGVEGGKQANHCKSLPALAVSDGAAEAAARVIEELQQTERNLFMSCSGQSQLSCLRLAGSFVIACCSRQQHPSPMACQVRRLSTRALEPGGRQPIEG